jgi:hypothetical protein
VRADGSEDTAPWQVWYAHGRLVDAPPPPQRTAALLARVLAPASTPVPHPPAAQQSVALVSVDRLKILLMSLLVGFVVAALTIRLVH